MHDNKTPPFNRPEIVIDGDIDISGLSIEDMNPPPSAFKPVPAQTQPASPAAAQQFDRPGETVSNGFIEDSLEMPGTVAEPVLESAHVRAASSESIPEPDVFIDADYEMNISEVHIPEPQPEAPVAATTGTGIVAAGGNGLRREDDGKGRIGDRLVGMGYITNEQLAVGLQEKKLSGKMLGEVLVGLGFITEDVLSMFLAESAGIDIFNPQTAVIDGAILALVDKPTALKHMILPISMEDNVAEVAMADPYDIVARDVLRRILPKGATIKPLMTSATILMDAIDAAYGYASKVSDILKEIENTDEKALENFIDMNEQEAFTHPIVRLVNALVSEAVKVKASDLHFEPEENFVRLRYRLDGDLYTAQILHKQHWNAIGQRLKIMAELNIADKLSPQDGRISMNIGGREVDFRVSSLPTVWGENIVMRVLDKSSSIKPLATLGFSEHNRELIRRSQQKPEGIIIVTGPTGSGKTTSLYSMLNEINTVDVNIQTLEDPVEYSLPMIRQTHVREGILEFHEGIKALMRQDPDIIFIGEIRDKISAGMALQAAMTGHQVYTTLHTNDSFGALPRLMDLGMVPGMVAGNIISVFAQRLVRTLCPHCKQPHTPTEEECKLLKVDFASAPEICAAKAGGCNQCGGTGYKGRVAVAEILFFDEDLDEVVANGGTKIDLKNVAMKKGFKSMTDDGILKVLEGKTTLEALAKVVDIYK